MLAKRGWLDHENGVQRISYRTYVAEVILDSVNYLVVVISVKGSAGIIALGDPM
jgi:hypothetical protein